MTMSKEQPYPKPRRKRLTFDFPEQIVELMQSLADRAHGKPLGTVIRDAIKLETHLVRFLDQGGKIVVEMPDKSKIQLLMHEYLPPTDQVDQQPQAKRASFSELYEN